MKHFILKILGLALIFTAFVACSDDDDDSPIVIDDILVVYNSDTGIFSTISITDGTLTTLGTITYEGATLTGLRDIVYNPANGTVYASSRANSDLNNGAIFSVNPETLEATMLNDNIDDDWYALPGIEMSNDKIIGTVYLDYYLDNDYDYGLIWLNLDGSINDFKPLLYNGEEIYFYEGMAIEYGASSNEILLTREDENIDILVSDLNGNVSNIIEMVEVGFPMDEHLDSIRTIETAENGILYGIDRDNHFGSIDLTAGTFTYIATLNPDQEGNHYVALSMIPETVFEEN